ncbi:hypothetical protein SCP_0107500 [Sparassis crispa]|uniref:Zn(2)-C6 fungal-type domain-containing protein n=1 Tax=Sparassis crispa TaxID=139825 RepID=A0A401G6T4_9APHY|nr:hypothetical protein SCP_0107500 [Sparassis crispa]GBE77868.1 hypothetical protein SCP_0107500 [Sparassis crispa]
MPKATATPSRAHASSSEPLRSAHILRRNQACHQCRRRKLKCDAKRPCSTCLRSHKYALSHAPAGAELPPHPECTYDDIPEEETGKLSDDQLKVLENRISELEATLYEKDSSSSSLPRPNDLGGPNFIFSNGNSPDALATAHTPGVGVVGYDLYNANKPFEPDPRPFLPPMPVASALDDLADVASLIDNPLSSAISGADSSTTLLDPGNQVDGRSSRSAMSSGSSNEDLMFLSWPRTLPSPELVRHLIEAFFSHNVDAERLFHVPTFLTSLLLPPTHPDFPSTGLLHAMCAMGSMYTAAMPSPPSMATFDFSPYDPFTEKYKVIEGRPDSFAESQAKFATVAIEDSVHLGVDLFQGVQALIILSWWYWANGMWSEAYNGAAKSLRSAVPCGLNICPPFHTIAQSFKPAAVLHPAATVIEDEVRRNTFWLAYTLERTQGCGNGWAMMLDDQDVSQLLPLRGDHFNKGVLVRHDDRQWSHDNDVLLVHPADQTDSFILYVKSSILLSRVKNFNCRFRARHHTKDPATMSPTNSPDNTGRSDFTDIRKTPAFMELDDLIIAFKASFPQHMKDPMESHGVDAHLFISLTASHLAQILLHETHAIVGRSTCVSSRKILTSARAILDLLHGVSSTSYDLSLLGIFPMICWYMAGRILVRFMRVAIELKVKEQCDILRAEIDYIRAMITRVGDRFPVALRYTKMLQDFITQNCGEEYVASMSAVHTSAVPDKFSFSGGSGGLHGSSHPIRA